MIIKSISEKEYNNFIKKYPDTNFFQSVEWAKFKSKSEWKMDIIGLFDKDEIKGASTLLYRPLPVIKKRMYYAPRGFVTDYSDFNLIEEFTKELKKYLKDNNGLFLKINPYIKYQDRDRDGNIIGKPKDDLINLLKKLGYHHYGFYIRSEDKKDLEPRWLSSLYIKDKTVDEIVNDFRKTTRWGLNKSEKNFVTIREVGIDELDTFKKIMIHTAERRDFEDRPLSYYQTMYEELKKKDMIRVLFAEIDFEKLYKGLEDDINKLQERIDVLKDNPKKTGQVNEFKSQIESFNKKRDKLKKDIDEHGKKYIISVGLYIAYGKQIIYLFGGSYKEYMEYGAQILMQYEMIKYAKENNYEQLNFYGIDGDFDEKSPGYGLFDFKRGLGADVIELIGEFDLVVNKVEYKLYNEMFKSYKFAKRIKRKIKK
jgi:lipid II:glycine glycyltransferase (peptidoglycan interpeptide bridge formation enzyme)